jgi:hypothetical protein
MWRKFAIGAGDTGTMIKWKYAVGGNWQTFA